MGIGTDDLSSKLEQKNMESNTEQALKNKTSISVGTDPGIVNLII